MKKRKVHVIALISSTALILSAFSLLLFQGSVCSADPSALEVIYVEPGFIHVTEGETGSQITSNVSICGATNVYGYEFRLFYNSTLLNGTAVAEGQFLKAAGNTFFEIEDFNDNYNATHGQIWVYSTLKGLLPGVNGTGTLVTVTFMTKHSSGFSLLTLSETKLSDPSSNAIGHTVIGGTVFLGNRPQIRVPADYSTIQQAVDAATIGTEIFVSNGTYYENVVVNKTVSLIGEDRIATIIDANHMDTGILVTANSVLIKGFTVQNASSYAIHADHSSFTEVDDSVIQSNQYGICLNNSVRSNLSDNVILQNEQDGVQLVGFATIVNNTFRSNGNSGIRTSYSQVSMTGNTVESNKKGIILECSGGSTLHENHLTNNTHSFSVQGETLADYVQDVDSSNSIDNKTIYYLINKKNIVIYPTTFPDIGYLGVINSSTVYITDLNLADNGEGILLAFTKNSTVHNSTVVNSLFGIKCVNCRNIMVVQDTLTNNTVGIDLRSLCVDVNILECKVNNVAPNSGEKGLALEDSGNNTLISNTVIGYQNAFYFRGAGRNIIYHNNLINNSQSLFVSDSADSVWDNGFQGNYWSGYAGTDTDSDGIGDTPYVLAANQTDYYPLTFPYVPNIAVTNISANRTGTYIGQTLAVTVSATNKWYENETFDVVVYANSTTIKTLTFANMMPFSNRSLIFNWNTSDLTPGNYTLRAQAEFLPNEAETGDNTCIGGRIEATKFDLDFNGDGVINALDLRIIAIHFGQTGNFRYDANFDNVVDMDDLRIVASNFGDVH